jgi:hypothetical protein
MGRHAGRALMTAGAIVTLVGLGIALVKTFDIPGYWIPVLVGIALFLAGIVMYATSRNT